MPLARIGPFALRAPCNAAARKWRHFGGNPFGARDCLANCQPLLRGFFDGDRVTFELLQAARAYRLRSAKLLSRVGLYPGQDALLMLLGERGKLTMGEAASALSIQPPTVTKMVNRLSAAQLVKTEIMEGDRRKISVSLTDAARGKIDEIDAIWRELEDEALEQINPQPLKSQLSAIARNLSKNGGVAMASRRSGLKRSRPRLLAR